MGTSVEANHVYVADVRPIYHVHVADVRPISSSVTALDS